MVNNNKMFLTVLLIIALSGSCSTVNNAGQNDESFNCNKNYHGNTVTMHIVKAGKSIMINYASIVYKGKKYNLGNDAIHYINAKLRNKNFKNNKGFNQDCKEKLCESTSRLLLEAAYLEFTKQGGDKGYYISRNIMKHSFIRICPLWPFCD